MLSYICRRAFSSSSSAAKVGFIGLGNMGGHMAHNLVKKGHQVTVYDVVQQSMATAGERGCLLASSPKELAAEADVVVTMLPSSPHVVQVYGGEDGVLAGAKSGAMLVDCSTIDPLTAKDVAAQAMANGCEMIDAPVSGGVLGAEAGTLTFMVGGSEQGYERAHPILAAMGQNIVHCGDNGTGQVAKICNNLVLAISMVGVSEGMALGKRLGMDPERLAGIFNTSTARCWSSDTYNPCPGVMEGVPSSRGYTGGFGVNLMKKDLGLAIAAAQSADVSIPAGSTVHQLYSLLSSHGYGAKDFSSVFEYLDSQQDADKKQ
eukprot:TRINITY_DN112858_c0_g1_i1.p1 TRINITY_DN112858_c0_g1~~TRINITY_DN112858_c0_g1_i1.p1  ORF type:complete len:318 (+),score=161.21 TRINITY_DN112858_c0_g1_i1:43-996(+)